MQYPDVTILIVTYDRLTEICQTIRALLDHVKYDGALKWHIADDHSPDGYIMNVTSNFPQLSFTKTITDRQGWGANVNKALQAIETDYIFLIEDDYVAYAPIDLNNGVMLLNGMPDIGIVRYDGIAGHHKLYCTLEEKRVEATTINYFRIHKHSQSHLNIYSNRPHLRHKRFIDDYGFYPLDKKLGETESAFAHHFKDQQEGCDIAILWDGVRNRFHHIGKSRQGSEFDV